jgi:DNA-binding transcriptional LysR family regulator
MIEIRNLETFYWAAQLGGFGRAATKLNTTQPAVSARIAALEAEFGVRLLVRSRGLRPTLTPIGAALFDQARRILALCAEAVATLSQSGGLRGPLRIGATDTIVHILLAKLLCRLRKAHPAVAPEVTIDVSINLREALRAGQIDLAFICDPSGLGEAQELPVCTLSLACVAAPELRIDGSAVTKFTARDIPILTYARNTQPYADLAAALADPSLPAPKILPNGSLLTIVQMAKEGDGVAVIPAIVVRNELECGDLRLLPSAIPLPKLTFVACWLDPGQGLPGAVASLACEIMKDISAVDQR